MPSDFLVQFHKRKFPDDDIPLYSKDIFYALVDELSQLEKNNHTKEEIKNEQHNKR